MLRTRYPQLNEVQLWIASSSPREWQISYIQLYPHSSLASRFHTITILVSIYSVETDDGYKHQQSGQLQEVPNEEGKLVKVIVVRGSYFYNDPDGKPQSITYYADQDGFHADGPSIPKNPEV